MSLRSLVPLLRIVGAAAAVLLLVDLALFRSGLYFRLAAPESTSGSTLITERAIAHFRDPSRRNILVLGDSRIGEGFSAKLADAASGRDDLHFVNGSIAGTMPRVWYYLLRAIDPDADRFAAVALMVDYDLASEPYELKNYPGDTSYLPALLRVSDIDDYPTSFSAPDQRSRARRAILFPLNAMREDFRDLLAHPLQRWRDLRRARKTWLYGFGDYPGHDGALPDLVIDPQTGSPTDWDSVDADLKARLESYFQRVRNPAPPPLQAANDEYLREWLGRIAQRYAARNVPVFVFAVPRGPWHRMLAPIPEAKGTIAELATQGSVHALPGDAFVALEQPQFFFDAYHLNRQGRERFSRLFAQQVTPLLH
jgi:hypothetical protein